MGRGDVTVNLVDGGLGNNPQGADGIHLKVGVAEGGAANALHEIGSYLEAKEILVSGPLLEAIQTYYAEFSKEKNQIPPKMYVVRPENDLAGSIQAVVHTGTGEATFATSGAPTATRTFIVEILKDGAPETATYRKSSDGGKSWSDEIVTPASGVAINMGGGCSIAFTAAATPADTFKAGDTYTFSSEGPTASVNSLVTAINTAKQEYNIRRVHVIGETQKPFWVTCGGIADDWEELYKHFVDFHLEAVSRDEETVAEWAMARINEARSFYHKRVHVSVLQVYSSTHKKYIPLGWVAAAKIAAARVHESPGFVDKFAFLTVTEIKDFAELSNRDTGDAWLDLLDNARYTVATRYADYPGFYISHVPLFCSADSDYTRLQYLRPADKIRRLVRNKIMKFLESPAHAEAGLGGLTSLKVEIDNAISSVMEIKGDREIVSHTTEIDPNQDILGTGKVYGKVKFTPIGTMEEIEIDLSAVS
jgi:hypothetical protein